MSGLEYAALALEDQDMTVNGRTVLSKATLDNAINNIQKDIVLRWDSKKEGTVNRLDKFPDTPDKKLRSIYL